MRGTAKRLRYDLVEGLPYFNEREVAITAEGILADVIKTQRTARVACDSLRSRQEERKTAVKSKKPAVEEANAPGAAADFGIDPISLAPMRGEWHH